MAAPPPQNDGSEPEVVTFGIAVVDAALDEYEISFPTDTDSLVSTLGDEEIPYDPQGRTIRFEEALEETGRDEFETSRELMNALHPVFEEKRESGGLGGWLRSLLPF